MLKFPEGWLPLRGPKPATRAHLSTHTWPAVVYAIGDVHGCLAELDLLEAQIVGDAAAISGEKWIVMLGDYVDRGPQSAAVLDRLCGAAPAGFRRICLAGNHEIMMFSVLRRPTKPEEWLKFGGVETLHSYGVDVDQFRASNLRGRIALLESHIPPEHYEFLENIPILLDLPDTVLVHAGIRRGVSLDGQSETDLLWIREPFLSDDESAPLVIHGHTPVAQPLALPNRINVDTGAYATGVLTAVRLEQSGKPRFLSVRRISS